MCVIPETSKRKPCSSWWSCARNFSVHPSSALRWAQGFHPESQIMQQTGETTIRLVIRRQTTATKQCANWSTEVSCEIRTMGLCYRVSALAAKKVKQCNTWYAYRWVTASRAHGSHYKGHYWNFTNFSSPMSLLVGWGTRSPFFRKFFQNKTYIHKHFRNVGNAARV